MIEPDPEALRAFTEAFRVTSGHDGAIGHFAFGDSPEMAAALGRLVVDGPKRATAGWTVDEDETPLAGQHDVVLGGDGHPLCIIRTTEVRTVPFAEADPAFAWDEGEGDRTLPWWREAHERFFARRAEHLGVPFDDSSLVNLERFVVVWPEPTPVQPLFQAGAITVRSVRPDDRAWVGTVTPDTTSSEDWPTDRLPALLARVDGRTAGTLVFHPRPNGAGPTEIVATAMLDQTDGVEDALRQALKDLARHHRWGHPSA